MKDTNDNNIKQEDNNNEDDDLLITGGGFIKEDISVTNGTGRRRTRSSTRKSSRLKNKKVNYVIDLDDDPDDNDLYVEELNSSTDGEAAKPMDIKDDDLPLTKQIKKTRKRKTTNNSSPNTNTKKKKKKDNGPKLTPFERTTNRLYEHHPELKKVFEDLQNIKVYKPQRALQPKLMKTKLLPFQLEGLHWLLNQENNTIYQGGILADEMGMGKTIQTISLLMSDLNDPATPTKTEKRVTLVVAPTVALMQWKNEIELHANNHLKCFIYHGPNKNKLNRNPNNDNEVFNDYNVILTTFSVLESCYRREKYGVKRKNGVLREKSLLHNFHFYRVVLDEAHNIKDRTSNTAKSVNELNTRMKWCLTGTPLQNRIGEMYSLIRFLNIAPFTKYFCTKCDCSSTTWQFSDHMHCDHCNHVIMQHTNFFNHFMLKNILKHGFEGPGSTSFKNIQILLDQIMLRRTKVERADDLGLPPRIVTIRKDFFNQQEKDLYQSLYTDVNRQYNSYVEQGLVLNNYANIFTLITRMRQMADHPDLVLHKLKEVDRTDTIVCQLCDDQSEDPIESKCHHKFCRICIKEYIESSIEESVTCPVCHISLSIDLSQPALITADYATSLNKKSIVNKIRLDGTWQSSTKIEALVEELYNLRSDSKTIKSIVFSQFTSMLDLIEWRLKRAGFQTVKLSGNMTPTQRDESIKYFMNNIHVEVFLVSLKAGGVALNLCEASQVFILDPWWNPSVEWQSGDRVHRIGQNRPVKITRFCIEDSIESRIIELQEKKANMINATINHDDAAISRLTPADLQFLFNN